MSGGFFRGTSADQDTRFSNKQARLLKSQKFAPELEHLVNMTKVKMDVIRPWIATRVTELLGFEDEVLINFIYGLLDEKEVNGKQVQISLTGFMEKNTGKFMKELWTLLLSAQRNASGVPQQFLDAKEEEARKKKAESDRIANEIQKKKDGESREREQERLRKMMDERDERKAGDADLDLSSKNNLPKGSSPHPEDKRGADLRNGVRRKSISKSPCSTDGSPHPRRLLSRSVSRSYSNSRSNSEDKQKSRNISRSPPPRQRSISNDRMYRSPRRRSLTPRSSCSPTRRRPSYYRRISRSRSLRRSPSPVRRRFRSPYLRRSPTTVHRKLRSPIRHHRSPSPVRRHRSPLLVRQRRRSPVRYRRSPSPMRRRSPSPMRRRSPSPIRHRSPSPLHRRSRSPVSHRSPSPIHRRSLLPVRRRYPNLRRRSPSPVRQRYRRSSTPQHRSSPPVQHKSAASGRRSITLSHDKSPESYQPSSLSPVRRSSSLVSRLPEERRSPLLSLGERQQMSGKLSPGGRRPSDAIYLQRDPVDQRDADDNVPAISLSPNKSPVSKSPLHVRNRSACEDRRSSSPFESPTRKRRELIAHDDSLSLEQKPKELRGQRESQETGRKNGASRSRHSPMVNKERVSPWKDHTSEQLAGSWSTESQSRLDDRESRKKDLEMKSERSSGKGVQLGTPDQSRSPILSEDSFEDKKRSASHLREGKISDDKNRSRRNNIDGDEHYKAETSPMLHGRVDHNKNGLDPASEGSDKRRTKHKEKRKHKRSERHETTSDDDSSYDSQTEDRREAKRRRKEEKRLRKEKRRRRKERRHRREERHAEKLKMKDQDDDSNLDGEDAVKRNFHPSDDKASPEHKQLEVELRKKALESLKAKKGISG
ncbi:Splicing factor PWI domain-containing protein, putative isoform 2 [Hibiscus syriacus]|uniref:Splicing factor PWI domain-containing protein, putative isoform 2 n=1 Tax=Hibiscus syriacus TaxID=106335 RepID=A0A6A2XPT2_HIBSY|nr:serine/arginine repetitive matrix protein 1-like [Hibiscus syriacus]KAE8660379.1 Splicing factor PWI domain-containing protein, putative isoform 2 [Hibiscus syriacus]